MSTNEELTTLATFADHFILPSNNENDYKVLHDDMPIGAEISRFSRSLLTFAAVMTIIIMIVGIFGNLLTIIALLKCPKVRNVAAAFIVSLCVADFIFCAIVLPFNAFRFIQGTWTHGDILCRVIPFMQYGNIGVSLLCIAMITINRYVMIAHHNAYAKIYKRFWIGVMIVFCWIFSYGMQLPTFFRVWGAFGYDNKLGTCSILNDASGRSSKTALFVIAFVIPCLIIIGCYTKIFWVVHKSENRMRKHANTQNSIPNNLRQMPDNGNNQRISSPVSSSSFNDTSGAESKYGTAQKSIRVKDQRDAKTKRNEWRITKMVLAIFLSFVICYLPITIAKVADNDVRFPGFHIFGYIMLYLSACINPIIYVIMNKQYRQAYKTVLMCKPSRLLPFANNNGGSSVGEKWKDIGYSYNHSRTMVSQVSVIEPNSSFSSSPQPVTMELTTSPQQSNTDNSIRLNQNNNNSQSFPNLSKSTNGNTNNTFQDLNSNSPSIFTISPINQSNTTNNNNFNQNNQNTNTNSNTNSNNNSNTNTNSINNNSHSLAQQQPQQSQKPPQQVPVPVQVEQPQQFIQRRDFMRPVTLTTLAEGDIIVEEEEEEEELSASAVISQPTVTAPKIPITFKEEYKTNYQRNSNAIPDNNPKISKKSFIIGGGDQ